MTAPKQVNRFEANLLSILRFTLGRGTLDGVRTLVLNPMVPPPCLSANAVSLVKDHLAKGVVLTLTRAGGWRHEPTLQNNEPVAGRVWDRHPLAGRALEFGPHTLGFLIWLTAEAAKDPKGEWDPPANELTPADELYLTLAFDALRAETAFAGLLRGKATFRKNPLCLLAFAGDVAPGQDQAALRFDLAGVRGVILECLQRWLEVRWLRREREKGRQQDWFVARAAGIAEFGTMTAFLRACEDAGQWALARFITRALAAMFSAGDLPPSNWLAALAPGANIRLAERVEIQRTVLTLPQAAATLARWDRTMQGVGYFDEGYAASQLWKAEWERANGPAVVARARRVLDAIEPLRGAV